MKPHRWDDLGADWTLSAVPDPDPGRIDPKHPLASKGGINALGLMLTADAAWRNLTKPQRELLLSCAAGYPVKPRADVLARMVRRQLVTGDLAVTDAGRLVIEWRLP